MSIFETNRVWNNEIKEKVKNADSAEIEEYFHSLSKQWTVSKNDIIDVACRNLNIKDIVSIDMGVLQIELEKALYEATSVFTKFKTSTYF